VTSSADWWPALLVGGLLTFLVRLSFIALLGRIEVPPLLSRALRFVPAAVLTAIIVPELLMHDGEVDLSPGNLRLLAGLVATGVALRTRSVALTIVAGMGALWALQAAVGGG
jgi:branched-subunit amino acid transport protein